MFRKVPLIVILGSTGTGKTKLSIELAQKFGGEIISADSMQVYKGLDVATAKATAEEQLQAPHHLLDVAHPGIPFTVVNFRDAAVSIIDKLLAKSKIPIIVGGTNYYIESILWQVLVSPPPIIEPSTSDDEDDDTPSKKLKLEDQILENIKDDLKRETVSELKPIIDETSVTSDAILKMTTAELTQLSSTVLHKHLTVLDSVSAQRLHPNNKRKIIRALEVLIQNGKTLSDILDEQRNIPGGCDLGGPLRYPHVILFWLRCDQDVLNDRLDKRVDKMLEQGLLREIRVFHKQFVVPFSDQDYTKGILQTIGFKEFSPYLSQFDEEHDKLILDYLQIDDDKRHDFAEPDGYKIIVECIDELKLVTRRYSKKQMKWVKNRFLGSKLRQIPQLYGLDTSNPINWNNDVYNKAENVVQSYFEDRTPAEKPLDPIENPREGLDEEVSNFCEVCQRVFIGEFQYQIHMKSNKHKKMISRKTKSQHQIPSVKLN